MLDWVAPADAIAFIQCNWDVVSFSPLIPGSWKHHWLNIYKRLLWKTNGLPTVLVRYRDPIHKIHCHISAVFGALVRKRNYELICAFTDGYLYRVPFAYRTYEVCERFSMLLGSNYKYVPDKIKPCLARKALNASLLNIEYMKPFMTDDVELQEYAVKITRICQYDLAGLSFIWNPIPAVTELLNRHGRHQMYQDVIPPSDEHMMYIPVDSYPIQ